MIKNWLIWLGEKVLDFEESKYKPNTKYGGEWVNKGTRFDEDWEWVEYENKSALPIYIHIYLIDEENKVINIRITREEDSTALYTIDCCENEKDIKNALELLEIGYRSYNVILNREIDEI